ncbi:DnaB-like helicase C-terminal domain-containing protein [Schleiferilactobacillus harbinensis]|uniref:DnaB-like helicase C-terminal domain-containing protein n=1 Tax=Schleiferilactobacillus harbinensis TaxID=304207 RepID=UPI00116C5793|nr:DnaB-like helicase C-terminal domain-containing protein [Schleiferilactobacillus harbinensis]GEK06130.1 DNA damage-inducible protein [Schleiferilactobacillus harbinensis]
MNSSENWLIGQLATKPRLIHSVPVKPEWFGDSAVRELVRLMIKLDGDWIGEMDLAQKFERENKVVAKSIDWRPIDESQLVRYPLGSVVRTLQKQYATAQAQKAAADFARNPDEKNATNLLKAFEEMGKDGNAIKGDQLSQLMHDYVAEMGKPNSTDGMIKTMPKVNELLGGGLSGGQLIIIGARPSTGKSAFVINMMDGIQRNSTEMVIDLYSLEMANKETRNRFISLTSRVPMRVIKRNIPDSDQQQKVVKAAEEFDGSNIKIVEDAKRLGQITQSIRARAASAQKGHYVAFIDYLGLIEPDQPTGNRYQDVTHITRALKVLANELDVPIVLLSQLNRDNARNNRSPELYDLRDSGSIEQDANVVIFLYRTDDEEDASTRQVMVRVAKNRDGELKSMQFEFLPATMLFKVP